MTTELIQNFWVYLDDDTEYNHLWFCTLSQAKEFANNLAGCSDTFYTVKNFKGEVVHTAYRGGNHD